MTKIIDKNETTHAISNNPIKGLRIRIASIIGPRIAGIATYGIIGAISTVAIIGIAIPIIDQIII